MALLSSQQYLLLFGVFLGFIGVALGAFGAHILKERLSPDLFAVFEVGVRYQFYHVFAICLSAWLIAFTPGSWALWAGISFAAGVIIFSGTLYILSLSGVRWWGMITPLGGLLLLFGWFLLAVALFKK